MSTVEDEMPDTKKQPESVKEDLTVTQLMKQLEAKGHKVQLVSDAAPKKVEAEEDPDFEPTVIEDFDEPLSDSEVKPKKRDD